MRPVSGAPNNQKASGPTQTLLPRATGNSSVNSTPTHSHCQSKRETTGWLPDSDLEFELVTTGRGCDMAWLRG